jgi:hypothetical protein
LGWLLDVRICILHTAIAHVYLQIVFRGSIEHDASPGWLPFADPIFACLDWQLRFFRIRAMWGAPKAVQN